MCGEEVAATLGATMLGGLLAILGGYLVGFKQRSWQREQAAFERQLGVARRFDEALVETERRILNRDVPEGVDRWEVAQKEWEEAWVRESPFLDSRDLKNRYEAAGRILTEIALYDGRARPNQLRKIALRATLNARLGIAYFGREEDLSPECFPGGELLTEQLGAGDPDALLPNAPLSDWLDDNPPPPWHPEPEE